jgi:hypothetical protein
MSEARDEKQPAIIVDDGADDVIPEDVGQRWVKYGLNVALTSLLVVVLAFLVIWAAQRYRRRGDLTSGGSYSLKPQTITVISDNKSPVKLVSLYPRLKQEPGKGQGQASQQQDFYQPVDDILQEYRRKGKNIDVDSIDPAAEPAKLDRWLVEVTQKYGGNVKNYREVLQGFPETLKAIRTIATEEAKKMRALPTAGLTDDKQADTLNAAFNTVAAFPTLISTLTGDIDAELKEKIPDYKGRVQAVESSLNLFSRQVEAVRKALETLGADDKAPQPIRDYAKTSLASYDAMKKQADDVLAKIKGLGELKLDDVRRRLIAPEGEQPPPAIAVMGEKDIKLIDFKDVWKSGESTGFGTGTQGPPRLRFAGEQQLTAAILSLAQPQRTKIAFVRGGGSPKTTSAGPFGGGGGDFTEIADRLKSYNFEVLEKDLSGQAMQRAMMGQGPPPNEPTDEQIKDAIWVVFSEPQMTQFGPMPGGNPELANKLREHLDQGGAAMVVFDLQGDDMSSLLREYGVEVKTNVVAVHEPIRTDAEAVDDFIEQARRQPPIFVINEYGGSEGGKAHPITSTLQSLDAALVPMLPVSFPGAPDATVTKLLPVPQEPRSWGESDISSVSRRGGVPAYDPASGDMPGPLYSGAAVEKKGKGRLVVIGSAQFANNLMLTIPDQKLLRQKVEVARFPGNGELFTNSIFWLGKMEKMIALSPAALDTPRIDRMDPKMLAFWRIGVLLIGLPALALAAGFVVWRSRRD